jgi:hypothetical protein
MDILSSLATGERTRLDTTHWLLNPDTIDGTPWAVCSWANHAVLILAEVNNFLCHVRDSQVFTEALFARWQALWARVESHEQRQPSLFRPLATTVATSANPFPSTLYINESVSAAMQIFDLARLLLLLARPERTRSERIARFANQGEIASVYIDRIVANSITNRHQINWATAVQLLSSAGHALVGWRKRKALLKCLDDIKANTGWNTAENMRKLIQWWGWEDPLTKNGLEWTDVNAEIGPEIGTGEALMMMFEYTSQ